MSDLSTLLSGLAGLFISLGFSYLPGLSNWYDAQTSQVKSLTMLICLILVTMGAYAVSCWQWFAIPGLTCDNPGLRSLLAAFLAALATNQSTYLITRRLPGRSSN